MLSVCAIQARSRFLHSATAVSTMFCYSPPQTSISRRSSLSTLLTRVSYTRRCMASCILWSTRVHIGAVVISRRLGIQWYHIVYRSIHGTAPRYLSDLLHRVSDITSRRRLRSSTSSEQFTGHPSVAACNCWWSLLAPGSETLCLRTLHLRRLYWCSDENWRLICFGNLIRTLYCIACVACCARWSLKFLLRPPLKICSVM